MQVLDIGLETQRSCSEHFTERRSSKGSRTLQEEGPKTPQHGPEGHYSTYFWGSGKVQAVSSAMYEMAQRIVDMTVLQ